MAKIVIVEDDVFLREELQNIVEKEGYSVESISSLIRRWKILWLPLLANTTGFKFTKPIWVSNLPRIEG